MKNRSSLQRPCKNKTVRLRSYDILYLLSLFNDDILSGKDSEISSRLFEKLLRSARSWRCLADVEAEIELCKEHILSEMKNYLKKRAILREKFLKKYNNGDLERDLYRHHGNILNFIETQRFIGGSYVSFTCYENKAIIHIYNSTKELLHSVFFYESNGDSYFGLTEKDESFLWGKDKPFLRDQYKKIERLERILDSIGKTSIDRLK